MPAAMVIGFVGVTIEQNLIGHKDVSTKINSISEDRDERLLKTLYANSPTEVDKLKEHKFVPSTMFEKQS